jgi:hypothetical protein
MRLSNKRYLSSTSGSYERVLETAERIYFFDFKEKKKKDMVRAYDRKMELVAGNHYNKFIEDTKEGFYSWMSEKMKKHLEITK